MNRLTAVLFEAGLVLNLHRKGKNLLATIHRRNVLIH
jgi:hypothetical protein